MAIATPKYQDASATLFALHEPLADALAGRDNAAIEALLDTPRELVLRALERHDADFSAVIRDEIAQLAWVAQQTGGEQPSEFEAWDRLLAASLASAEAGEARESADAFQGVVSDRILQLLGDGNGWQPSDISTRLGVTRSQVSRALRHLRDAGHVQTEQHEQDGRGQLYRLEAQPPSSPRETVAPANGRARTSSRPTKRRVVSHTGGRWVDQTTHSTQAAALAHATAVLAKTGGGELVVKSAAGKIRSSTTIPATHLRAAVVRDRDAPRADRCSVRCGPFR